MTAPTLDRNYSDKEIDAMRRKLARLWNQSVSQVTDAEARYYLGRDREFPGVNIDKAHRK